MRRPALFLSFTHFFASFHVRPDLGLPLMMVLFSAIVAGKIGCTIRPETMPSGLQKEVFSLYRSFLRVVRQKPKVAMRKDVDKIVARKATEIIRRR